MLKASTWNEEPLQECMTFLRDLKPVETIVEIDLFVVTVLFVT